MYRSLPVLLAFCIAPAHAADAQSSDRCGRAMSHTVKGKTAIYMGTIERQYRVCTTNVASPAAKRLEIFADGTPVASIPTNKGGSTGLCVDVGGKRIEVAFDQDDFPFAYYAVSALAQ